MKMRTGILPRLAIGLVALAARGATQAKPNIVLVFIDDMGCADLGCYGSPVCRTPNIDRLAAEGMRFTDAYAACTVCSPTRAALLTGKYPARLRITDWIPGHQRVWEKLALPDWNKEGLTEADGPTLPELLKRQGYASAMLGKWHVGKTEPTRLGFDLGEENWERNRRESEEDPKGVFSLAQEALDFFRQNPGQPVFVYLSHFAVHGPVRSNSGVRRKYEQAAPANSPIRPDYAAMVEALDDSVGLLMKGLEDLGVAGNTLVAFYSDNGGQQGPTTNMPFREGKGYQYEGGLRVPLIVRWPGRVPAGAVSPEVVTTVDFLPTFCEVAGVSGLPPDLDGTSFLPVATKGAPLGREAIYWHYPHYHQGDPGGAIRKGNYKLIEFFEDGRRELYDLASDPGEKTNLVGRMPEKAGELLADLQAWRRSVGAQMMEPNPDHDPKRVGKKKAGGKGR